MVLVEYNPKAFFFKMPIEEEKEILVYSKEFQNLRLLVESEIAENRHLGLVLAENYRDMFFQCYKLTPYMYARLRKWYHLSPQIEFLEDFDYKRDNHTTIFSPEHRKAIYK